jgi:hypothetical protein
VIGQSAHLLILNRGPAPAANIRVEIAQIAELPIEQIVPFQDYDVNVDNYNVRPPLTLTMRWTDARGRREITQTVTNFD